MKPIRDQYTRQIARLLKAKDFKQAVRDDWWAAKGLFKMSGKHCACLTGIRAGMPGPTPKLSKAIMADVRIPLIPGDITPESLPAFAEWQRRLDREIRGKK